MIQINLVQVSLTSIYKKGYLLVMEDSPYYFVAKDQSCPSGVKYPFLVVLPSSLFPSLA
ncbi:hypothetical protein [Niallia taxi]|uniref:hypothetical protein n=1 Tax=Niallia taxi TaxID=2499688 RepID=UPI0025518AC8|nr:hypothetical protein [Niallia taxi]MDK8640838.1 hypothetical protein [Niallia taxi]